MADRPAWLRAVARIERTLGEPLEEAVNSRRGGDVMMTLTRGVESAKAGGVRVRSATVHVLSLPSRRDVEVLSAQVARLQQAIDEIAHRLDDRPEG